MTSGILLAASVVYPQAVIRFNHSQGCGVSTEQEKAHAKINTATLTH
jgi:hypothetical protein